MSVLKFSKNDNIKNIEKKHIIIAAILAILLIIILFFCFNPSFRNFFTIYIFRKQANQDKLNSIALEEDESSYVYAYDKYITVLKRNILYTYNASGNVTSETDLKISNPLFASNNRFLAVAEQNGDSIYLISGSNIIWQSTIDGNISKIKVNNNGYVSVIVSGTSYKSIVITFDSKGKEMFKTYLSSTIAVDTDISNDNKYLSVAEVDYSGSIIKSMIKTISIETAKSDPTNSVVFTFNGEDNSLITKINYQNKNILSCMYNDSIHFLNINDKNDSKVITLDNQYNFADVFLKNNIVYTSSKSSGFSNNTNVDIYTVPNGNVSTYQLKGSIKSLVAYNEKVAINVGSEIHFVGLNGWLLKKYTSSNEINSIILGDSIAGVVYKDKVEIIQF